MVAQAMFESGFHRSISGVEITESERGRVRGRLTVSEEVCNTLGTLHGGAIATVIDDIGTIAVMTADHFRRIGVTTDLQISYLAQSRVGDRLTIEADVVQCGRNLAFVEVALAQVIEPAGAADLAEPAGGGRKRWIARGRMTRLLDDPAARRER